MSVFYSKIEYVSVRTYLSKNRIRTLRILGACASDSQRLVTFRCYLSASQHEW